jgi:hypothetical protein
MLGSLLYGSSRGIGVSVGKRKAFKEVKGFRL